MTVNPDQLRHELTSDINYYRKRVKTEDLTREEMETLIKQLLFEREVMLEEFDAFRQEQTKLVPKIFFDEKGLNLMLGEMDEMLYNDFISLSDKLQLSPGEILTSLMKDLVLNFNGTSFPIFTTKNLEKLMFESKFEICIKNQSQLSISNDDLIEMDQKINFSHIGTLEFTDVDLETFSSFVGSISHCKIVRVPKSIPKLILWSKCNHCSSFQLFKDGKNKPLLKYAKEASKVVEDWNNNNGKFDSIQ
jgi:hypothetical protein